MKRCPECKNTYSNTNVFCPRDGVELAVLDGITPGTTIRRKYLILEEIGRGGLGVVYRAQHIVLKQDQALKLINSQYATDPEIIQRFLAEALMGSRIHHLNVVRVEDAEETEDGQPYVVMEYVRGQTLRQIVLSDRSTVHGGIDPVRALDITAQVASALAAAHSQGIIHRDIKPNNIMLTKSADGTEIIKVFDFGIAKAKQELRITSPALLTQTGAFIGTPQYSSPEQASASKNIDERTDFYSLGIVLYELLAGEPPFIGDPGEVLQQHIHALPPPLRGLPPIVNRILTRALAKEPAHRYASAESMRKDLLEARSKLHSTSATPRQVTVTDIDATRWRTPRRRKIALTAFLAMALLLTLFAYSRYSPPAITTDSVSAPAQPDRELIQQKLANASQLFNNGTYDEVIRICDEVLKIDASNVDAQKLRANAESAKLAEEKLAR